MSTTRRLDAALDAASRGWHVFPLRPNDKRPTLHGQTRCPRTGDCADQHRGWEQRATTDPTRIQTCWGRGDWNIGVATGPSRLVVIDLDRPKPGDTPSPEWHMEGITDGEDVLATLCDQAGQPLPYDTFTVTTARGGRHLYFTAPNGVELRNTAGALGWLIDTRAGGGYILAPGSTIGGRAYTTVNGRPPASLPEWLLTALTPPPPPAPPRPRIANHRSRYLQAAVTGEIARVLASPPHGHNNALYVASVALGQLVAGGELTEVEVQQPLLEAALRVGQTSNEAHRTIHSGLRAGTQRPRSVAA
jgi:hypothetical protein